VLVAALLSLPTPGAAQRAGRSSAGADPTPASPAIRPFAFDLAAIAAAVTDPNRPPSGVTAAVVYRT